MTMDAISWFDDNVQIPAGLTREEFAALVRKHFKKQAHPELIESMVAIFEQRGYFEVEREDIAVVGERLREVETGKFAEAPKVKAPSRVVLTTEHRKIIRFKNRWGKWQNMARNTDTGRITKMTEYLRKTARDKRLRRRSK